MKFRTAAFNTYLLAGICVLALGCPTTDPHPQPKAHVCTLRLHLEVARDGSDRNEQVPIFRASPVWVNVNKTPFLTEAYVVEAKIVEELGGFSIQIHFDRHGRMVLENVSATNNQKHFAVFVQFPETRWLGAPRFTKRIDDGTISFVPDASREEAERIVNGLNEVAKQIKKRIGKSWSVE